MLDLPQQSREHAGFGDGPTAATAAADGDGPTGLLTLVDRQVLHALAERALPAAKARDNPPRANGKR